MAEEVRYPEATHYMIVRHPSGVIYGVTVNPQQIAYLGKGCVVEWQGSSEADWIREKAAAGIEEDTSDQGE
jgi:hypothetical protein